MLVHVFSEGQGTGKRAPTDPSGVKENKSVEDTAIISADDNIVKDTTDKVPDHRSIIDETELDEVQKTLVDKTSINKSSTTDSEESQETLSQKVPFKEIRSDDYQKLQGSDDVAMRRQDAETEIQPGQSHSIKTAASQSDSSQADQSLPRQDVEMETQPSQSLSVKTAASQSNSSQADQSLPERPQPSANWSVASEMARHSSLDEVVTVKARSIKKLKASVEDASIREDQKLKASVDEASIREDKKLKASVDEAPIREDQKLKASVDEASKVTRADKKRKAQADETESPAKIEPEVKRWVRFLGYTVF